MLEDEFEGRTGDDDECSDDWSAEEPVGCDSEEELTAPCPYCRREIYEESLRCPYCERYISTEDSPREAKPWWIVVGAVAALYAALQWIL